jgi:putative FmdB family regulatory protein
MPIYEFECQTCGKRFEELMRLSDPDPTECPCGKHQPVRRALTAPAFRLAGSGWYETDFKKDADKKRNLAGGSDGGDAKPADGAKTEPAKATESKPAASGGGTSDP